MAVSLQVSTLGSHPRVPPWGPTTESHLTVPPQGPNSGSHHRVVGPGSHLGVSVPLFWYVSETATGGVLNKKLSLNILQYSQETPVLESCLIKFCNFIKRRYQQRCFSVNTAKFLKAPILPSAVLFS